MQKFLFSAVFLICCHGVLWSQAIGTVEDKIWTLQDCIAYAIDNNISVLNARLTLENAEIDYRQSKSERLPNLFGNASQSMTNGSSIDPITSDFVSEQIHSTSLGLNTNVPLYQGGELNHRIKQNRLLADQNSLYVKEAENNIILSIAEAYLQALYGHEALKVAENNLMVSEKEMETAKIRYESGSTAKKDYSDAIAQKATNKYNLIAAQKDYDLQLLTLKQMLELGPETNFQIENPDTSYNGVYPIEDKMIIYEAALGTLPELDASRMDIDISEKDLDIAKSGYLPSLSLSGSLGTGYTSTRELSFSDQFDVNFNQRIGLSLNVPIFNRNQTKAQVQKAQINIEKSKLNYRTEEKELYKKIETAWQNSIASQEQLLAAQAASDAAKASYELAKKQYDLGALSTTDLVVSQNTYTNAQQNYLQSKYLSILYAQLLQFYQGKEIKI